VDECESLQRGARADRVRRGVGGLGGRGLHSSTSQFNVSSFCGTLGTCCIKMGHNSSETGRTAAYRRERLRLSREVDECRPLLGGHGTEPRGSALRGRRRKQRQGKGLYSSTSQLNLCRILN